MGWIKFTINKGEVQTWLDETRSGLREQFHYMVQNILNTYMLIASVLAPEKSSELRQSTTYDMESEFSGIVWAMAKHFAWIILGRGEVVPVNKKALYWPELSHPVMRSGPTTPNDYMADTVDSGEGEVETIIDNFGEWVIS